MGSLTLVASQAQFGEDDGNVLLEDTFIANMYGIDIAPDPFTVLSEEGQSTFTIACTAVLDGIYGGRLVIFKGLYYDMIAQQAFSAGDITVELNHTLV